LFKKEASFALEMIELNERQKNLNRNHLRSNDTVLSNLRAILLANLNQTDKAIKQLRDLFNKYDANTNKFTIFPSTLTHLENHSRGFELEMNKFYSEAKGRLFSPKWDIIPFSEHLTKLAMKNKYEQKTSQASDQNKKIFDEEETTSSPRNELTETDSNPEADNKLLNVSQPVQIVDSGKLDSQISRLEAILERIDERLVMLDKRVIEGNETSPAGQKDFTMMLNETVDLYRAKSYSAVIKNCREFLVSYAPPDDNAQIKRNIINMLIFSISKCKVEKLKSPKNTFER